MKKNYFEEVTLSSQRRTKNTAVVNAADAILEQRRNMDSKLKRDILKAIEELDKNPVPQKSNKKKKTRSQRRSKAKKETIVTSQTQPNQPTFVEIPIGTKLDLTNINVLRTRDGKTIILTPKLEQTKQKQH